MASKPFKLAYPDPSEDQFQESVANLLHAILVKEKVAWTHIAHGGYELSPKARGRLMRLGLQRGFPDLVICYQPARTLWLELKTATGKLSLDQRQKHVVLSGAGHRVVTLHWSSHWAEDLLTILELHQVPFRQAHLDRSYHGTAATGEQGTAPCSAEESAQGSTSMDGARPAQQEVVRPVVSP